MKTKSNNNSSLKIFLASLFISILIWTSMSLSKMYQKEYSFPVIFKNIPINKRALNNNIDLKTTVTISGWDLMTKSIKNRKVAIDLNIYPQEKSINFANTKSIVKEQFSDLEIEEVLPMNFIVKFKELKTKKIAIKLNLKKNFPANYFINKETILLPDSLVVSSDQKSLDELDFIETEEISITEKDTLLEKIKLIIPSNIKSNFSKISAKFNIEEFAEKKLIVPVNIENKPDNVDLVIFPEQISLKCLIPFSEYEKITAQDFYISADFNNIELAKDKTIILLIKEQAKSSKNIQLEKDKVEFVIYSN